MDIEQSTYSNNHSLQNTGIQCKTGRVIVTAVSHIKEVSCDEVWQIMRGGPDIGGAVRVKALAPGDNLFHQYLNQWKDADPQEWWHLYEEQFIKDLNWGMIKKLMALVKSGKTIALFCFCRNVDYCHRSIVAKILQEQGAAVEVYEPDKNQHQAPESRQLTLDEFMQE